MSWNSSPSPSGGLACAIPWWLPDRRLLEKAPVAQTLPWWETVEHFLGGLGLPRWSYPLQSPLVSRGIVPLFKYSGAVSHSYGLPYQRSLLANHIVTLFGDIRRHCHVAPTVVVPRPLRTRGRSTQTSSSLAGPSRLKCRSE